MDGQNLYTLGIETYKRAKILKDENTFLKGIDFLKRALQTYTFYDTYGHLGRAYRLLWEQTKKPEYLEEALKHFKKAVAIMPIFEEGWVQIGLLYAESGRNQEAMNVLIETKLRYPEFVERSLLPGASEAESQKELEVAALLYNLAAFINPRSEKVFQDTLSFYQRINRPDMAERVFVQLAGHQSPKDMMDMMNRLLLARLEKREWEAAYRLVHELQKNDNLRSNPSIWFYSGLTAWLSGRPWEALGCWNESYSVGVSLEQLDNPVSAVTSVVCLPLFIH